MTSIERERRRRKKEGGKKSETLDGKGKNFLKGLADTLT